MAARCRFVQPEMVRLEIAPGEWIEVKKRLTIGETRKSQSAIIKSIRADGRMEPDLEMIGKAQVCAYLLDWNLCDVSGRLVPIDTETRKSAALDMLDAETFEAISGAIDAHITEQDAILAREKKQRDGATDSDPISPSVE